MRKHSLNTNSQLVRAVVFAKQTKFRLKRILVILISFNCTADKLINNTHNSSSKRVYGPTYKYIYTYECVCVCVFLFVEHLLKKAERYTEMDNSVQTLT